MIQEAVIIFILGIYTIEARSSFIINGNNAYVGELPWQGSIQVGNWHSCGCSLISKRFAVTAAHCIQYSNMKVGFGKNRLSDMRHQYKVKKAFVHPLWNTKTLENDIALLQFEEDVEFTYLVKPISLADSYLQYFDNEDVIISGWGAVKILSDGRAVNTDELQKAHTTTKPSKFCIDRYWNSFYPETQLCLYEDWGKISACFGDSGGPAVIKRNGRFILVGVTSWVANKWCTTSYPNVYTKISSYRNWIKDMTGL